MQLVLTGLLLLALGAVLLAPGRHRAPAGRPGGALPRGGARPAVVHG